MGYKNILIDVRGGTGKNFALASICEELKQKYEHVSVISPYVDIFQSSAFVDKAYQPQEVRSAIEDAADDTFIVVDHIYDTNDFIRKEISYQDAFRVACGLKKKNEKGGSEATSNLVPLKSFGWLKTHIDNITKQIKDAGYENFIIVQFTGGQSPLVQVPTNEKGEQDWGKVPYQGQQSGLSRHYPIEKAAEFCNLFAEAHPKTAIINYNLPNEYRIDKTFQFVVPYLVYYELAKMPECLGTVSIDSSLQHMVAGVTKSIVIWGHSHPDSFGYKYNKNIIQPCKRDGIKYFSALGPAANRIDYIEPKDLLAETDKYLFEEKSDAEN